MQIVAKKSIYLMKKWRPLPEPEVMELLDAPQIRPEVEIIDQKDSTTLKVETVRKITKRKGIVAQTTRNKVEKEDVVVQVVGMEKLKFDFDFSAEVLQKKGENKKPVLRKIGCQI